MLKSKYERKKLKDLKNVFVVKINILYGSLMKLAYQLK